MEASGWHRRSPRSLSGCGTHGANDQSSSTGGVHHFAMVHDSFGVHASDIDVLNHALREEFVRIYSEPVLQNFLNEQRKAHPDVDLPEIPQTGSLDIRQVISSPYFFA
jgi:DNA-directed RNA polymerase